MQFFAYCLVGLWQALLPGLGAAPRTVIGTVANIKEAKGGYELTFYKQAKCLFASDRLAELVAVRKGDRIAVRGEIARAKVLKECQIVRTIRRNPRGKPLVKASAKKLEAIRREHSIFFGEIAGILAAQKLAEAYQNGAARADRRYKGKLLKIQGRITDIGKDVMRAAYIMLGPKAEGEEKEPVWSVLCRIPQFREHQLKGLEPGQRVIIAGRCVGRMDSVVLQSCKVLGKLPEKKELPEEKEPEK